MHDGFLWGMVAVLFVLMFAVAGAAFDKSIDANNKMLCESAKVSGNEEYSGKCQTYYATGDIKYMRGME